MAGLTNEQAKEAATLYLAGESTITLAEKYDTSTNTVAIALRREGVELRDRNDASGRRPNRRKRLLSDEEEQEVIEQYQAGYGAETLGKQFGVSKYHITVILKRHNVSLRSYEEACILAGVRHRRFSEEQEKDMVARYEALESAASIARVYESNANSVSRILVRRGVTLRGMLSGPLNPMWRGGIRKKHEYQTVAIDPTDPMASMAHSDGCVLVHRLVMARHLGRPLRRDESVHHIDNNPKNNDISNLQLRQGKHGSGVVMECLDCGSHNLGYIPIADPAEERLNDA